MERHPRRRDPRGKLHRAMQKTDRLLFPTLEKCLETRSISGMSFADSSRIRLGAASGVVAHRGGYADRAAISRTFVEPNCAYGPAETAFGVPFVPNPQTLFVPNASEPSPFPVSLEDAVDRISKSLAYAKETLSSFVGDFAIPDIARITGGYDTPDKALATGTKETLSSSPTQTNSKTTLAFFLAGAGTSLAVYYLGPEWLRKRCRRYVAVSRRVLYGWSVSAEAFVVKIGLKEGLASAYFWTANLANHERVVSARKQVSHVLLTAAPLARDAEAVVIRTLGDVQVTGTSVCVGIVEFATPKLQGAARLAGKQLAAARSLVERSVMIAIDFVQTALAGTRKKQ